MNTYTVPISIHIIYMVTNRYIYIYIYYTLKSAVYRFNINNILAMFLNELLTDVYLPGKNNVLRMLSLNII